MLKNKLSTLLIATFVISLISCGPDPCLTKDQFVESYKAFFEEVESEINDADKTLIKSYEKRYVHLLDNCFKSYKDQLSKSERQDFWQSSVKFYLDKEGGIFNIDFSDKGSEDPVREFIVEELEDMADSSSQDFSKLMESVLEDELPRLIDSVVDKVENVGEEIKASLKKK